MVIMVGARPLRFGPAASWGFRLVVNRVAHRETCARTPRDGGDHAGRGQLPCSRESVFFDFRLASFRQPGLQRQRQQLLVTAGTHGKGVRRDVKLKDHSQTGRVRPG